MSDNNNWQDARFLTIEEAEIKYRLPYSRLMRLVKNGVVYGLKVPNKGSSGKWMILHPGDMFQDYLNTLDERLAHIPLLSTAEAAEVLGTTVNNLHQLIHVKRIRPARGFINKHHTGSGQTAFFTLDEVRKFLWKKEKKQRQGRRVVKIQRIIDWAKVFLDKQRNESIEGQNAQDELDQEIDKMLALPEPARTQSLRELFLKLDKVAYLREVSQQEPPPTSLPNDEESATAESPGLGQISEHQSPSIRS